MHVNRMFRSFSVGAILTVGSAFVQGNHPTSREMKIRMPYQQMGLTKEQAAAHLLSRFTFGAKPGQVNEVVKMGLENWLEQQLNTIQPDEDVNLRLPADKYEALKMSDQEIVNTYLNPGQIIRLAAKKNLFDKDSIRNLAKPEYRAELKKLMEENGYKPPMELQRQLINQKIIRAAYGNNQLREVLTDFWFNHFNVSLTKGQSQQFVLSYERDAIRPNVLGRFQDLLEATAKHPAMLEYLDNASSVSMDNDLARRQEKSVFAREARQRLERKAEETGKNGEAILQQTLKAKKAQGLNENYAREIMELHTLGVDGGYTQKDVTELARALTGWGIKPMVKDAPGMKIFEAANPEMLRRRGFVVEGDFLFRADKHDESPKTILGRKFPANGGYAEGEEVLAMLANHPSTAHFIATKLATRFVCDTPSAELVSKLADAFLQSKGDIKTVLITLVNSPEFWSNTALREKIKSPFEYAISAIRATNADVQQPFQIYSWCTKMGQRFYYYQAPTGFPDRAGYWINTGSLLNRMNFGLAFATQKIPGVKIDLAALNDHHEPESAEAALRIYSQILLPERNQDENIRRLTAMVRDVNLGQKLSDAADKNAVANSDQNNLSSDEMMDESMVPVNGKNKKANERALEKSALAKKNRPFANLYVAGNVNTVSQVTGIILGSPEFQRK
ncbi:MAG: DUF1800 domain-containing protein [Bacteroidota bacterium]|nr:DUF1800 domain-containing protein [Bacteroidota bacterium]